jgi:hypothetical protein
MTTYVDKLADPDSLLGMLQRGRGKGYLIALESPPETVWPLLYECVTNDPRLDKQVEDREEYYGTLILATRMDLEPFRSYLVENNANGNSPDWSLWLPLGVVSYLAEDRQNAAALQILREYVLYGQEWEHALRVLADADTLVALEQSVAALCHRINSDANVLVQFHEAVQESWKWYVWHDEETRGRCRFFLPICEPWKTICAQNGELADLFRGVGITYDQAPSPKEKPSEEYLADLSLEDLFAQVDESNRTRFWRVLPGKVAPDDEDYLLEQLSTGDPHRMVLAFRGLGELGTPRAFEAVKAYIKTSENADRGVRVRAFQAIAEMPGSLTLDTARQWFRRKEHYLHIPAGDILENHATLEDVPMLIEALRTPETVQYEDFRLSSALDALARFDGIGPMPELEAVFRQVQHCFGRYRAAHAMAVTAPVEFASEYAFECLWDCHWDTRALGCETVSLSTPGALERLKEIATDAAESDNVRQPAQERLEGF